MFRISSTITQTKTPQLPHASRNTNPHISISSGVIHSTSVSRPQLKSYQVKEKVVPNISQVNSNSRTSNANAVCAECGTCVFNSNHDACVSRYLKVMYARTKKPHVVPISASKPKRKANKSVATPHKKTVASDTTIQKSKSYYKKLYEDTKQEWKWKDDVSSNISPTIDIVSRITNIVQLILFIVDSGCTKHMTGNLKLLCNSVEKFLVQASVVNVKWCLLKITLQAPFLNDKMMSDHNSSDLAPQRQEMSVENVSSGLVPQGQKASDYDNSDPVPPRQNVVPSAEKTVSSHQGLEFLFSPLLEEYYNPTHGLAEENNNDQAPNASFQEAEFVNPFCTRVQEIGESSSHNIDNTDVHSFQPQSHDFRWTRDHNLEPSSWNPPCQFQTRTTACQLILKCVCSHSQFISEEGDDFRIILLQLLACESSRFSFAHSAQKSFPYIRMDVKTAILKYCFQLKEEVYVAQPEGFVDPDHPEKVYLLRKALYGLKQAPRAWYDELSNFLMSKGFTKAFSASDFHAGCLDTRKSTSGGIQFPLVIKLINPMIQPEREIYPRISYRLEIAVLRFTSVIQEGPTQYLVICARTFRSDIFSIFNVEWKSFPSVIINSTAKAKDLRQRLRKLCFKSFKICKLHVHVGQDTDRKMAKDDKDNDKGSKFKFASMKNKSTTNKRKIKTMDTELKRQAISPDLMKECHQ
ncbi:retrovirus-related pol polyprotein from transposon TNT 1-94 [Tanacetum coccineum]|uniref:Retrovirus-related pol polyprotein from transposon TNT 1-94 n=1 Tax=Tanacetum coccineum TaxID=301880 RepID=A0ABQ5C4M0_9ASTR